MNIRDIMTAPPITVLPSASVQEVALLMSEREISGVPVVNEGGDLLGLVTELHLIARNAPVHEPHYIAVLSGLIPLNLEEHREYKERLREALATTAGELMDNTEIPVAGPDDPIDAAFDLLATPEYTLLPIVEGEAQKVVGVVTRTDLVRLIGRVNTGDAPAA